MSKVVLNSAIAGQYELVDADKLTPVCGFGKWGFINFAEMSLAQAQRLIDAEFPYLKIREAKADKKTKAITAVETEVIAE